MLYNVIIAPIEMVVDWVFVFFSLNFTSLGVIGAVCGVSLVINFLALPLYNIADSLQEKERKIAKSLEYRVSRIKKAFKGDEQFMMLATFYRQNNYHPLYTLRSSLSILIEVPFFIAAYHYLSNCEALKGSSFWIFADLGSPDSLLHISNVPIHILPIIMTAINIVSGIIYTKNAAMREKIQLYLVSLLFLVLLYRSPSGLVIYWILNNLFSLAKNVIMQTKNPGKILHRIISFIFAVVTVYFLFKSRVFFKKSMAVIVTLLIVSLPYIKKIVSERSVFKFLDKPYTKQDFFLLVFSGLGLTLLAGFLLPSSIIASSPIEFSFLGKTDSPVNYIFNGLSVFAGVFLFYPICIFKMFGNKTKKIEPLLFAFLFFTALADAFIFKFTNGNSRNVTLNIDTTLSLGNPSILSNISLFNKIAPVLFSLFVIGIFILLKKFNKINLLSVFIIALCFAEFGIGLSKISFIKRSYAELKENMENSDSLKLTKTQNDLSYIKPVYHISKSGKNVVVIFLDRAISSFLPYALEEVPELKNQLKGFIHYPNTVSFAANTTMASPSLMGGYEYVPELLNKRDSELLRIKHNEASLVMPKIFSASGWEVTITDPPIPNYRWRGDLSNFSGHQDIHAYELSSNYKGIFKQKFDIDTRFNNDEVVYKEIKNFSVLQIIPPICRYIFYDDFRNSYDDPTSFLDNFSRLYFMKELTDFAASKNQFIFIDNETTHEPTFLNADFMIPCSKKEAPVCKYNTEDDNVFTHYQTFVASLKQLGLWFDFLRQNNVYDNTRIIIVSDHGGELNLSDFLNFSNPMVPSAFNPLFMLKDFNCNDLLKTNNDFMTNADTIFMAKENLDISNVNPFTGNTFVRNKDNGVQMYFIHKDEFIPSVIADKKQFTLDKQNAFHVSDNIFDEKNWLPLLEWEERNRGAK